MGLSERFFLLFQFLNDFIGASELFGDIFDLILCRMFLLFDFGQGQLQVIDVLVSVANWAILLGHAVVIKDFLSGKSIQNS